MTRASSTAACWAVRKGAAATSWVDFDLFGHQLVCHLGGAAQTSGDNPALSNVSHHNMVDDHNVPVPHFGVVLNLATWRQLRDQLLATGVSFVVPPHTRFAGQPGEQATMFLLDPSGNALEFKAFADIDGQLFKK